MKKLLLCALLVLAGCSTVRYNIALQNVESPMIKNVAPVIKENIEKKERIDSHGEKHLDSTYTYAYSDDNINIVFTPTNYDIGFDIQNKTDDSIKIIWDDAAFVDTTGNSHKVMHKGVKYIDRNASWPPSIVVKQQRLSDVIVPTDYIEWTGQDWKGTSYLPTVAPKSADGFTKDPTIEDLARQYIGKKVQVLLPLQINNQLNNYIFTFEVKNFEIISP